MRRLYLTQKIKNYIFCIKKGTKKAKKVPNNRPFQEKYFFRKAFFQEFAALLNKKPNIKLIEKYVGFLK